MWFPLIALSVFAAISSSFCFSIEHSSSGCPPASELKPCTCSSSREVSVLCQDIKDGTVLNNTFSKHPNWKIEKLHFDRVVADYLPPAVLRYDGLKEINISSSTFGSLFFNATTTTPEVDIWLYDVKLLRGLEWKIFQKSSISGLGTFNFEVRYFGKDFKEYMNPRIKNLWFENSKTVRISDQAFSRMKNLDVLAITGGSLKKISRDMFPRPWVVKYWNFGKQKIADLPADIFDDLPNIIVFSFEKNLLTTIDEKFSKSGSVILLEGNPIECNCDIKWILSSGKRFDGTCADKEFHGKNLQALTKKDLSFCK